MDRNSSARPAALRTGPTVIRFSTADYAPRDRLAAWQEVYGRTLCRQEIEPVDTGPLHADVTFCKLPDLGIMTGQRSPAVYRRNPWQTENDNLFVTVSLAGTFEASQLGRETHMDPGDALVGTGAEPIVARVSPGYRSVTLSVPLGAISPAVAGLDAMFGRKIPAANPALRLMSRYVGVFDTPDQLATPVLQRHAVTHIHDLLALALGATREAAAVASLRGARAARLREIKADIEANLGETLSVGAVAARHRLAVRYVQRLFEATGTSFTDFVLERRLARAHRLLTDPRLLEHPIGVVAFEAGFTDQPYFNRAFRARFGAAPSDVRAQARREN